MFKKLSIVTIVTALSVANVTASNNSDITSVINKGLKSIETPADAPDWLKRTSINIEVEEDYKPKWEVETVQPIYQFNKNKDIVFWQLNANTRDSIETYNFGLGYRNIINPEIMLGLNSFYDYQADNKHKRWSMGIEAIGKKYEFRANRYMAISNKLEVETDVFEEGLSGWDVEVGGKIIPNFDVKIFGAYSHWEGEQTDDLKQTSARIEYPLNNSMDFEVKYTHDNEQQVDMEQRRISAQLIVRLGAHTQESMNIKKSENLSDKLLIPVKRENEIVIEKTTGFTVAIKRGS